MRRTRISDWPRINISVHPRTLDRIEQVAESRGLPVSVVIRQVLDWAYNKEGLVLGGSTLEDAPLGKG